MTTMTAPTPAPTPDERPPVHHTGILASFWYYRTVDLSQYDPQVPLILDSGAYSAFTSGKSVSLPDYAAWLDKMPRPYDFAFNLDVIGDSEGSYRNWLDLRERGHLTTPVLHYGDREPILDRYIEAGADRVALSGAAMPSLSTGVHRWHAYMFRYMDRAGIRLPVHGLGVHMRSRLARLPWDTTDSSAPGMAWRFGRATLWSGRRWIKFPLDGKAIYRHADTIRRYGTDPATVAVSNGSTRSALIRMVTRSEVAAATEYGRRLPAPWSVGQGVGSRYLADTTINDVLIQVEAITGRYLVDTAYDNLGFIAAECEIKEQP